MMDIIELRGKKKDNKKKWFLTFAKPKIKLRMRRRAWRPYTVGLVNFDYIKDKTLQRRK